MRKEYAFFFHWVAKSNNGLVLTDEFAIIDTKKGADRFKQGMHNALFTLKENGLIFDYTVNVERGNERC